MKKSKTSKSKSKNVAMDEPVAEGFLVVGIGASAGGIQALKIFFENVPADSGIAYIVILHLSPDYESHLSEVLQTVSKIPVTQVTEKVLVEPNRVYVVPPNQSLSMSDGHIVVSKIKTIEERRAPVDIFFRTLAESHHERAVCVVLSGTGADGSMGLKRIKERGGVVFVQNPREAGYNDMPRNAIATNLVDEVLNASQIPAKIIAFKENRVAVKVPVEVEKPDEEQQQKALRDIFTHLRVRTGHDFTNYKRPTVLRRIERRINVRDVSSLGEYADFLRKDSEEVHALLKDLLISVTNFFRDEAAFQALEKEIVPRIVQSKTMQDQIRVWIVGCATGEEAYSVAMLFAEQTLDSNDRPTAQIFATDIDETAIAHARAGFYTLNDAADVSPERLRRFFTKEQNGYRIRREIREMVLFANHNVIKDPPFSRLDLVTCRNVLIYLNQTAQKRVLETFHFALKPSGFLFLGSSESVDGTSNLFAPFIKENQIYQNREIDARPPRPLPNSFNIERTDQHSSRQTTVKPTLDQENQAIERLSYADLHQRLLEQFAPPSVVVNEEYDIIHLSERAGRYMQITGGMPTRNLLKVVREELRLELRTALYQALQKQANIEAKNLTANIDGRAETLNIHVRPVMRQGDAAHGFILVLFEKIGDAPESSETIFASSEPIVHQLEEELVHSKEQLRSSIEQYEIQAEELKASNEELQAMNEELRSSAEELETSKEELQSINEELVTVNQELKIKIEELSQSNNDFQNLMSSTDIGAVFLDRAFRVKLFTPPARHVINLLPSDLGRPLTDLTTQFSYDSLHDDMEAVLDYLQPIEREILTYDERWFLMRILPYRTDEDQINGAVLTFFDITERKHRESEVTKLARQIEQQARIFDTTLSTLNDYVYNFDREGRFLYANKYLLDFFGLEAKDVIGKTMAELNYPKDVEAQLLEGIRQVFDTQQTVVNETSFLMPDGTRRYSENILNPFFSEDGAVEFIVGSSRNVTERKQAEESLRQSEERARILIESASDFAIFRITPENIIASWNTGAEKVFGFKENEIIGQSGAILFTPEDRQKDVPLKELETAREKGRAEDERWHLRKDGSRFFASGVMMRLREGAEGFVKIARDQTMKIVSEKALRDKEMLEKLVAALEEERKRIARDLHDELGQKLTALRLKLETLKDVCDEEAVCNGIDEAQEIARQIDGEVDFLAWELRPAALDDLGLVVALENYVIEWSRHSGIKTQFHAAKLKTGRLSQAIETNLYRITQEALNNILKHAKAKNASVMLEKRDGNVLLIIEDNGGGFDVEDKTNRSRGMGLIGMLERAAMVGGTFEIESAPKQGTTVFVRVPFVKSENGDEQEIHKTS